MVAPVGPLVDPVVEPIERVAPVVPDVLEPLAPMPELPLDPIALPLDPMVLPLDPMALPLVPLPIELVLLPLPEFDFDALTVACDFDFDFFDVLCFLWVLVLPVEAVPSFVAALAPDGLELVALAPEPFADAVLPPAVVAVDPVVLPDEVCAAATPTKHANVPAIRRYESLRFIASILS